MLINGSYGSVMHNLVLLLSHLTTMMDTHQAILISVRYYHNYIHGRKIELCSRIIFS